MSADSIDIQKQLVEYFKDYSDRDLSLFIDSFCFFQPTDKEEVSNNIEQFISDMGLGFYRDFVIDTTTNRYFHKTSFSQRSILADIIHGLLVIAYNRFKVHSLNYHT